MKKLITSFTLIVILFNFIFCYNAYGDEEESALSSGKVQNVLSDVTVYEEAMNNSDEQTRGLSVGNTIASILMGTLNIIPLLLRVGMGLLSRRYIKYFQFNY